MKKQAFLFISILIGTVVMFSSCEKEKEEVDIRDSYVGTYQGTESWTNSGQNYTNDVSLTITKSTVDASKIILTATFFNNSPEIVSFQTNNGNFTTSFTSLIEGVTKTVTISSGILDGQKISYSFTAPGYVTITVNATKL